jgi:chemotaxis protein methyltransferase CheR
MIYFDHYVRQTLIAAIEQVMQPGGILMIGHAETLSGLKTRFTLLRPSVYVFHEVGLSDSEREIRVRHVKR